MLRNNEVAAVELDRLAVDDAAGSSHNSHSGVSDFTAVGHAGPRHTGACRGVTLADSLADLDAGRVVALVGKRSGAGGVGFRGVGREAGPVSVHLASLVQSILAVCPRRQVTSLDGGGRAVQLVASVLRWVDGHPIASGIARGAGC